MENFKHILSGITFGVKDAVFGIAAVWTVDKNYEEKQAKNEENIEPKEQPVTVLAKRRAEAGKVRPKREKPKVLHRILQCCALNGGVFLLSILAFHGFILPNLRFLLEYIFGSEPAVWVWLKPMLAWTFGTLWVLPLFILSKVVNSLWFQDIADSAYRHLRGRPQMPHHFSKLAADTFCSVIIQFLFLIQSLIVGLLPIMPLGQFVSLVHLCMLYSLYAFEYKWFNMGWELHKRLSFIEYNWPYFLGFGLPLALLTSWPTSYMISGCLFSILFPFFIVSGNEAAPVTGTCVYPLPLFSIVVYVSNTIFHHTFQGKNYSHDAQKFEDTPTQRPMPGTPTRKPVVIGNRVKWEKWTRLSDDFYAI